MTDGKRSIEQARGLLARKKGSALILTMLILLVLTALGMVALRDVARTVQQAGSFRVRAQAETFAGAVSEFMTKRAGDNANGYWKKMQSDFDGDMWGQSQGGGGVQQVSQIERDARNDMGAMMVVTQDDSGTGDLDVLDESTEETGLFYDQDQQSKASFEQGYGEDTHEFEVVFRDPLDGIPVPGYSSQFCFKKVYVATQTNVGRADPDWDNASMVATRQAGSEILIGPVDCGSQ